MKVLTYGRDSDCCKIWNWINGLNSPFQNGSIVQTDENGRIISYNVRVGKYETIGTNDEARTIRNCYIVPFETSREIIAA